MSETIDVVVSQVLERDDLDEYAVPIEIVDGLDEDEDLAVVIEDPIEGRAGWVLDLPIVGRVLCILWAIASTLPAIPSNWDYQGIRGVAVATGTLEEGDEVEIEIDEAVVEETRARGETLDREVHLWAAEVVA